MNTHTKKIHPKVVDEKEDNEVEIEIELNETEFDDFNMPSIAQLMNLLKIWMSIWMM